MKPRTSALGTVSLFSISALALCLWIGSAAPAPAQRMGAGHAFGHLSLSGGGHSFGGGGHIFGGGGHFHGSGFSFGAGRPFRHGFHGGFRGGSHVFFGLNLGFYDPYWYDPYWYRPAYYYPAYPPAVVYNVYPDDYRPYPPDRSRTDRGRRDDTDDYYLNRKPSPLRQDPALRAAVDDIETAFRTGDMALLEKHVNATDTLRVQSKGARRRLSASDYLSMTRDALKEMHTVRFTLDHVESGSNGTWMVYGTHVLRGDDAVEKTFRVSFVLKKSGDTWFITEVSADADR